MKKFSLIGLITLGVSLLISVASGYCTISGFGKVFASATIIAMIISGVIELGRVVLTYVLHHYWDKMPIHKKIPGILMLCISILLSSMGIFGFLANAHSQRTQEIVPIELEIKEKENEIVILEKTISANTKQITQIEQSFNSSSTDKAVEKYTEMGYVTKAIGLKKEQLNATKSLYAENTSLQKQINVLNKEILDKQLDAEKKAPTLSHLKYYAKLFNVSNDSAIIIFIVMVMMVFDTLAIYLMITSDWVTTLEMSQYNNDNPIKKEYDVNNEAQQIVDRMDKPIYVSQEFLDNLDKVDEKVVEKITKYFDSKLSKTVDDKFSQKLESIEKSLQTMIDKNISKKDENNIDEDTQKLLSLINDDESVIYNTNFQQYIKEHKYTGKKLLDMVSPSVKKELEKVIK